MASGRSHAPLSEAEYWVVTRPASLTCSGSCTPLPMPAREQIHSTPFELLRHESLAASELAARKSGEFIADLNVQHYDGAVLKTMRTQCFLS